MSIRPSSCGLAAMLLLAAPCFAQDGDPKRTKEQEVAQFVQQSAPNTDPEHAQAGPRSQLQVSVGKENDRAVLSVGDAFDNGVQWNAALSSPWGDGAKQAEVATLDGLANGSKLSVELSYARIKLASASVEGLQEACAAVYEALRARSDLAEDIRELVDAGECDDRVYAEATRLGADKQVLSKVAEAYFGDKPFLFRAGVKAGVAYDTFEFLDADLAATSARRSGFDIGINASWQHVLNQWVLLAGYQRQRAYDAGDLSNVCVPIENSSALRCFDGYLQAPRRVDRNIASVEWRWQQSASFAVSVRAAYDSTNDVFGVNVPIYLFGGNDGPLKGGVKLGWRSDTDDVQAAVFVSTGFNLL